MTAVRAKGLLLLCCATVLSGAAGWSLRGHSIVTTVSSRGGPTPSAAATPGSVSSHESARTAWLAMARQYRNDAQQPEAWARLYGMFQDLPEEEFARAIAELPIDGQINGETPGVLLAGMWAERDLPAARAWVLGVKTDPAYAQAVFATWARQDLPGMLAWVEANAGQLKDWPTLTGVLAAVSQVAADSSPEQGLQLLDRLGAKDAKLQKLTLYQNWARLDPAAASERALKEPSEGASLQALKSIADDWGQSDPEAAVAFAKTLPNPRQTAAVILSIAEGLEAKDQPAAISLLYQNSAGSDRLYDNAKWRLQSWLREDPVGALQWAVEDGPESALLPALMEVSDDARTAAWEKLPPEKRGRLEEEVRRLAAQGKANPLE